MELENPQGVSLVEGSSGSELSLELICRVENPQQIAELPLHASDQDTPLVSTIKIQRLYIVSFLVSFVPHCAGFH